ncbi:MAG: hypothetical protein AB1488_06500 [Nitrospirota bacterium]
MCEKNVIIPNGKKLYLATFEFISGEYGQIFEKVFYAKDEENLKDKIHRYFIDYDGIRNTSEIDGNVYYYWHGEIAVKQDGWEKITSFKQLVNKLI